MAKTKGPLHSLDARGALGGELIYKGNRSTNVVKIFKSPRNPKSSGQVASRSLMSLAVLGWQGIIQLYRDTWEVEKIKTGNIMSGYNYYCSSYVTSMRNGVTPDVISPEFQKQHYSGFSNSGGWVWNYLRAIDITNATGGTLTDFQVEIILDSTNMSFGNAQANGEDIRFTNQDDSVELSNWIMEYDQSGQAARIFVKVASLPVGTSHIHMYYGNEFATSSSNGDSTMEFFDDFDGAVLDPVKWDDSSWTGTIVLTGGILQLTSDTGADDFLFATSTFGQGYMALFRSQFIDRSVSPNHEGDVGFRTNDAWEDDAKIYEPATIQTEWGKEARNNGSATSDPMGQVSDNLWHIFRIAMISGALCRYQVNNNPEETMTVDCPNDSIPPYIRCNAAPATTYRIYTDFVAVRQAVLNEPTFEVGVEEDKHFH